MDKKTYTYQQMQEKVADYCLDMLSDEEKTIFENSISLYDDIATEVKEMKTAFSQDLKKDYNELMERKAVNVSVLVNEALENKGKSRKYVWFKVLAPVTAVVLLFFVLYDFNDENISSADQTVNGNVFSDIWSSDAGSEEIIAALEENYNSNDLGLTDLDLAELDAETVEETYDEMMLNDFFDELNESNAVELNEYDIYSILDNLDENDVEQLLKEFENVKIIS